mmetsp:Transcript_6319/g.17810  ORF Transcript_6319/g.17810 Transcript_6319/m.17810 type:complete len:544 (+) Transcript_6319:163-1794(+)|eukprot:CAMPEP_0168726322 /NCGR_PEP_ID=MMETSP0724-20121128/4608_1 /TAXON_ID=265536 /ORGANISM="Amphiprora sp., Strain CCMP467" /LENGTH=543 /DNA_ID=CAMNT_0008773131 /DNA_START=84 /DNA_END=1715 /DNA_ORIENTATION=+
MSQPQQQQQQQPRSIVMAATKQQQQQRPRSSGNRQQQQQQQHRYCGGTKAILLLALIPLLSLAYSSLIVVLLRLEQRHDHDYDGQHPFSSWMIDSSSSSSSIITNNNSHIHNNPPVSSSMSLSSSLVAPWRNSTLLPHWMKQYFAYHQEARYNLSTGRNRWTDYRYLVVRCLHHDAKCGGGADRLKSLPFMLLLADQMHRRILLYQWERPTPLQEFLQPPVDGLDWRWPPHPDMLQQEETHWMAGRPTLMNGEQINKCLGYLAPDEGHNKNADNSLSARLERRDRHLQQHYNDQRVISIRYQSHNHGRLQYDALRATDDEPSYDQVFRQVWYSVFVPTPPVQAQIDERLGELQLQPGRYQAIHIRSQYIQEWKQARIASFAQSTVHCLHQLLANQQQQQSEDKDKDDKRILNTTVFVSSDGVDAAHAAVQYARQRGWHQVVTDVDDDNNNDNDSNTTNTTAPQVTHLHLDRGHHFLSQRPREWTQHEAPHYYDTFVDLYVLSHAQCIVFGFGNYGRWANLMSTNVNCHLDMRVERTCTWPQKP